MSVFASGGDRRLAFLLVASGTVLGLAGTDLVLPAVPGLPREIGGGLAGAQLVIAATLNLGLPCRGRTHAAA